ncbi:Mitochondrial amidoxime-reducing component 1 [Hypsizygus marmoreus]|uniref:Mitochondrial amidoxime-reducing component 1 n=1 Tax=Hypsizygus marmoreus TaxID=39966 RepID=A0A369JFY1_HYPMA|nr:Mitochondrial amidoxime-reducing component 1 [Hypsizygus marmoreus]
MSSTFQPSEVIDALLLAARRFSDSDRFITWSWSSVSASIVLATILTALLLRQFVLKTPRVEGGRVIAPSSTTEKQGETQKMTQAKVKPADGTVRVSQILIHPIKSCRGTSVQSVKYTPQGLENDRKWCIVDAKTSTVITAREVAKMVLIVPQIDVDAASRHGGTLTVTFPEDSGCKPFSLPLQPSQEVLDTWEILPKIGFFASHVDGYISTSPPSLFPSQDPSTPSTTLSTYFGKPVHLVYKGPSARAVDATYEFPELKATSVFQDMYPLLVLSEESMGEVEREVRSRLGTQGIDEEVWREGKVVIRRFRPNIVLSGGGPFAEDQWEEIAIGRKDAPKITLVSKCARCLLPNVSPDTGERDKAVPYKVIMKFRTGLDPLNKMKPCIGCNGVPEAAGVVSVGDVVFVRKMIGE